MSEPDSDQETPHRPRRPRWCRRVAWSLGAMAVLIVGLAVAALSLTGRQIAVPDWLRDEIGTRINAGLAEGELEFGRLGAMLDRNGVVRLVARDLTLRDSAGADLAHLSDIALTLAPGDLLRGTLQPRRITLAGGRLLIRRSEAGDLRLAIGDGAGPMDTAPGFTALLGQVEGLLLRPELRGLTRIEAENLTIAYEDARAGRAWTVDGGRLSLTRTGQNVALRGDFALLGDRGYATTLEMSYRSRIGATAAELGVTISDMPAQDIALQSPALAWLEVLDAPISGALRASLLEDGGLGPLNATLQIGGGALRPGDATRPIPFAGARSYFTYDPASQSMQIDELFIDSKWGTARAEGRTFLVGMEQGLPREFWSQLRIAEISANPAGLYPAPLVFEEASFEAKLVLEPFALTLGQLSLSDRGQRLVLSGAVTAEPEGWDLAVDGRMDGLAPGRLVALWPESVKSKTRNWIRDNVETARLSDVQMALRARPGARPELFLGFDFDDLTTRFMAQMPVIEGARGHGSLYDGRFVVTADAGQILPPEGGTVEIDGTSFVIPTVAVKQAPARVHLKSRSTITAALALLDHAPFGFIGRLGLPVTLAEGRLRVEGELDFLLKQALQPEEVAYDIRADARGVRSAALVPDRVLSAPRLAITARNGALEIGGAGRLGRVPAEVTWRSRLGRDTDGTSQLRGTVDLSERVLEEFGIGLPAGSVTGRAEAQIEIDFARGAPARFRLGSDLAGLGLRLEALDWAIAAGESGRLEVSGRLGAPPEIDSVTLDAPGLLAEGALDIGADGQLERASFSRVRAGTWLDAPVDLIGRGAGRAPAIEIRGGSLDLRQFSLATGGETQAARGGGPLQLLLDRVQITDAIALTGFAADLSTEGGAQGRFTAQVNDGAAISGEIVPQGARSALRIRAADAGGVLRAAGLPANARGGTLDLTLAPASAIGSYNGRLEIGSIRLRDAPGLAALLNALSIVGLLEQLDGEGIHFSEVEADFQLTPDRVILTRGSAVGASMGISMDGFFYPQSGQLDMRGVFTPFYLVNAMAGLFSRRGEGLLGVSYALTGKASAPLVRVNPLSVFTPGMFREIFRRPPPQVQR